jgi:DNA-binding transcriptional MocR family regulator
MFDDSSARIVAALESWLADAAPGARLPSTRTLVADHGAGPVTVQRALRVLAERGLVETRPGVGTFARATRTTRPADHGWQTSALGAALFDATAASLRPASNEAIAMHSGYPDGELLPERLVRSALAHAARRDTTSARTPTAGLPDLQSWFAAELDGARPGNVVVTPGSQSGLGSVFRALVTGGRPLLIESPTYWGAILAARRAGARLVPVDSGPSGPDPDDVDRAFADTGARAFYCQPHYANPTGAQWSPDRAERILDVVRAHRAFLIEDDWAHDFGIDSTVRPLAARDDHGHVVYLRSLSKSVSPGIRVAAVIARGPIRDRILADHTAESLYVSGTLQAAALDVVTRPAWHTHLRALRRDLRTRRDLLLDALREHAPAAHVSAVPAGGLHLWVRLPDGVDTDRVVRACEAEGVLIAAGDGWFPAEPTGPFVRLNYAGPNPGAYPRAAETLARAIAL